MAEQPQPKQRPGWNLDGRSRFAATIAFAFCAFHPHVFRMNLLPFGKLAEYKPRHFVPEGIDLGNWENIAPLFDQLDNRAAACKSVPEFERWLLDWGEFSAALDQESSCRYIAMTCHTDNEQAKSAYLHFVEKVEPELKPRQFKLSQLFVAHPLRTELD